MSMTTVVVQMMIHRHARWCDVSWLCLLQQGISILAGRDVSGAVADDDTGDDTASCRAKPLQHNLL